MNEKYVFLIKKYGFMIVTVLVVFVLLMLVADNRTYNWNFSLSHKDKQPFGCAIFDSVMSASLPSGYKVMDDVPEELDPEKDAVLYVKGHIGNYDSYENSQEIARAKKLMKFVDKGGVVILATSEIFFGRQYIGENDKGADEYEIKDSVYKAWRLEAGNYTYYSNIEGSLRFTINKYLKEKQERIPIKWDNGDEEYYVYSFMRLKCNMGCSYDSHIHVPLLSHIVVDNPKKEEEDENFDFADEAICTIVDKGTKTQILAFAGKRNKKGGFVEYVSVPLFFTNYAMMDEESSKVTEHLLEPVAGKRLIRIVGKNLELKELDKKEKNDGIFQFFFSKEPLKWAFYLTLITLLLFTIFSMRRKMRPIPLLKETKNSTLEFAKHMGTYYFSRREHSKPVKQEYESFLRELSDLYGWDVKNMSNLDLADAISEKTGEENATVLRFIRTVNQLYHDHGIEQKDMMALIDYIKELKSKI